MAKKTTKEVAAAVEESTATAVSVAKEVKTEEQQEPIVEEVQDDQEVKAEEKQELSVEEVQADQEVKTEEQQEPIVEEVQADQETVDKPITEIHYLGRIYGFTDTAPEQLRIDGQILSKQEILSNPDVLSSMIERKNIFITEI